MRSRKGSMRLRFSVPGLVVAALIFAPAMRSQSAPQSGPTANPQATPSLPPVDGWGHVINAPAKDQKPAGAPRHDISGTWEPANGPLDGIGVFGAKAMPEDGKPEHQLPFTPAGLEALKEAKPTFGPRSVLTAESNDPVVGCDPQGIARQDLNQLRTTQILQTPLSVVLLYQFNRIWRVVWTDGREAPKDAEPRWFGYSVGKWVDDYTLVVETTGTDDRTWLDHVGRPHSDEMRVEERFHRVDHNHLELSVTIDDPKMYTKPWVALDKFPMKLEPPSFDIREMICSPSETALYNKLVGEPASGKDGQ
jgi:hypothetical protein